MGTRPEVPAIASGRPPVEVAAESGYTGRRHELRRVVSVHQWLPRPVQPARGHLPLPLVRRSARGRARPAALRTRSAAAWMQLFDERHRRNTYPYGSGVWGKKEWVLPDIDDENVVSTVRGRHESLLGRALRQADRVEDLWIKLCGNSHTGSFKDLGMTVLVSRGQADDRATACRSTRSRAPRPATPRRRSRPTARRRASRRRAPAARTRSRSRSSSSRSRTARSCSRSTPTSTAAWRSCRSSPKERRSTSPTR